jgi:Zn-dependent M32 family carboxypeptidase
MAAQIYDSLIAGQPQIMNAIEKGNFAPFIQLCRQKLYWQPRHNHYNDYMRAATGQELKVDAFLARATKDISYTQMQYFGSDSVRVKNAMLFKK